MTGGRDLVAGELTVGGRVRSFTVRLPRSVRGEIPLVLVLHSNHPDAGGWIMRERTTFDQQCDARGFAVAYPDGHGGCWADGRGVTTADEAGVDDVAFLRAIIDWSAERHGTWPDRTVAAGLSNGAIMAHRMGLEASDQVAVLQHLAEEVPALQDKLKPLYSAQESINEMKTKLHEDEQKSASLANDEARARENLTALKGNDAAKRFVEELNQAEDNLQSTQKEIAALTEKEKAAVDSLRQTLLTVDIAWNSPSAVPAAQ